MVVSWMVLQARPDQAKEIEILVLRHQTARAATAHPATTAALDRPSGHRCAGPAAAATTSPRHAGHTVDDPALAPPTHHPPLVHPARPARPTRRPCRRPRPDPAPGQREPHVGL